MQKNGEFLNETREYLIKNMFPKRPWINYLWNDQTVAAIDQFGCGISWFRDENGTRKNITNPKNNRMIFIRDEETKEFWVANRNFDKKDFTKFHTTVGQGYSEICSEYMDIESTFKMFIPTEGPSECWDVTVTNNGNKKRSITLTAYVDADANVTGHMAYNQGRFLEDLNGVC